MKKFIFFDLDNTIHDKNKGIIPASTIKLLKHLSKMPNTYLGLATGRGPYKISIIEDLLELFTYKIFINGAIAYNDKKLIYENPISNNIVDDIITKANSLNVSYGLVSENLEYMNPKIGDYSTKIYQVWIFSKDKDVLTEVNKDSNLICHPWHKEGADLVDDKTNKAIAIKELLKNEENYKLICVGDGHNDIDMIEMADVGIAMGNSGFSELIEKAHFVAPDIDKDELYDFFEKFNFFL